MADTDGANECVLEGTELGFIDIDGGEDGDTLGCFDNDGVIECSTDGAPLGAVEMDGFTDGTSVGRDEIDGVDEGSLVIKHSSRHTVIFECP